MKSVAEDEAEIDRRIIEQRTVVGLPATKLADDEIEAYGACEECGEPAGPNALGDPKLCAYDGERIARRRGRIR